MLEPPKRFWAVWMPIEAGLFLLVGYILLFTGMALVPVTSLPPYYWVLIASLIGMTLVGFLFRGPLSRNLRSGIGSGVFYMAAGSLWLFLFPSANPNPGGFVVFEVAVGLGCVLLGLISWLYTLESR